MPQGDKSAYTHKQKRKAEHIEEGYEKKGVDHEEAERRAWATVNKDDGGGKKSGSGRGKDTGHPAAHKGGRKGGEASASRSARDISAGVRSSSMARKLKQAGGAVTWRRVRGGAVGGFGAVAGGSWVPDQVRDDRERVWR